MEQKMRSKKMFLTRGEIRLGDLDGKGISGERESSLDRGGSDRLFRLVWFISGVLFFVSLSLREFVEALCLTEARRRNRLRYSEWFQFYGSCNTRFGRLQESDPASLDRGLDMSWLKYTCINYHLCNELPNLFFLSHYKKN